MQQGQNKMQNPQLMIQKNKPVFSSNIVFVLELLRLFLFAIIISPLLLFNHHFFLILFAVALLVLFISIRKFQFYEGYLKVCFIVLRINIVYMYNDISKVIYSYGQYGGMSVIIIKHKNKYGFIKRFFYFLMYRFVLENKKRVIKLLKLIHEKNILVQIDSDCKNKQELINQIMSSQETAN